MTQVRRIHRPAADVKAMTRASLGSGSGMLHAPDYVTADYSGWCKNDLVVDQMGQGHWRMAPDGKPVREPARTFSMKVRCRRCEGCLKERRCMWARRAVSEWKQAASRGGRTWFVTLTFRPEVHYRLTTEVRLKFAKDGGDFDAMSWKDRYSELLKEYHAEVDRFLDRVRKGLAKRGWGEVKFRYLMVPEPHKSGMIHYHLLIHEASLDQRLVKRRIEAAWGLGFSVIKLVDSEQGALYATKYLGKHHYEGRIRNSRHYGAEPDEDQVQLLNEVPIPHPPLRKAPVAVPPSPVPEIALRQAAAVSDSDEDAADVVREGEFLGVCPSGLHIGEGCDCSAAQGDFECDEVEVDQLRGGVPVRKWPLRGWHETSPRRGAPGSPDRRPDASEGPSQRVKERAG